MGQLHWGPSCRVRHHWCEEKRRLVHQLLRAPGGRSELGEELRGGREEKRGKFYSGCKFSLIIVALV